ncbi:lantibiotic dehydratase [Pseudonocardia sp.]|uniref:lantibiotic dehydratase n=1 Tax=Pseudonocardia sp. TaxID=60912 RepID=UPI0026051C2F|nr:lantibiotic dehydratase [Pseudonocardia sp.]
MTGRHGPGAILQATGTPSEAGTRWIRPPFFMLRLGGLPADAVAPLRSPASVAWAEGVLGSERRLTIEKDRLADLLQSAVRGLTDEVARRKLLEIRRHVYNLRVPDPASVDAVVDVLPAATSVLLRSWLRERRDHRSQVEIGDDVVADELGTGRAHLRALADHPHIRRGLLLASPSIDRHVGGYLTSGSTPSKRARRMERSVLEYVYRTACKTSPFSYFTPVGLGRFEPGVGSLLTLDTGDAPWRSHTRLNLAVVARIAAVLTSDPALRADIPVEITGGWQEHRGRIRYVRRQRRSGDDDAAVTMDTVQENLFYLANSGVLHEVFAILAPGVRLRFADLRNRLVSGPSERRDPDQVEAYLGHLLRLGLLVTPTLHVDIHHPDPVRRFCAGVRDLDRTWATMLSDRLDAVADAVAEYGSAPLESRRTLLESIRLDLLETQDDLGAATSSVPRTVLYEDVSLPAGARADSAEWDALLHPALTGLARILPVFDMTLPHRLVMAGYFRSRYGSGGRCDDVVTFVHEFHQDFFDRYVRSSMQRADFDANNDYVPHVNWLNQPELRALDRARSAVVDHMRRRYADHPSDDTELVLDDSFIDDVASELPAMAGDIDPHCYFLQLGRDGTDPFAVLNRAYTGLTLQFSRFAHCFTDGAGPAGEGSGLVDGLRATLDGVCPPGAVLAEVKGGYETTNLNLHPVVTPFELVCPGDVSFRPAEEQIAVDDLVIVDDGGRLRLRSRRLDVEVIPVYLGFLVPLALPETQQMLLRFSYSSMARIDLWSGTDRPLGDDLIGGHPRVRYRNLVLTRRLWKTHPRHLPLRSPGCSESEHLLAWRRWRAENGLPERVFVTPDVAHAEDRNTDPGGRPAMAGTMKPQYVDFGSLLSLGLLDNTVRSATHRLVFTEMLPDLEQLWLDPDGRPHVAELTVEIDGITRSGS